MANEQLNYGWTHPDETYAHEYLLPAITRAMPRGTGLRILDIGCGNGYVAGHLASLGHHVVGIDVSPDGIDIARANHPKVIFHVCSLYDDSFDRVVASAYDVTIATEVIEHLYWPRSLLRRAYGSLASGGRVIVTTPYHGYFKNLALSIVDGWDKHFHAEWDGGHIKFFSRASLGALMREAGFTGLQFHGAGRAPGLWKSMVATGQKPADSP
jgi:2-polyprenyl-3-methyl-5-hydroxy-6-metoxy-1,4-benzoquinol methylase